MRRNVTDITALALALCLLLAACGGQGALPLDAPPEPKTSETVSPAEPGPLPEEASGEEEAPPAEEEPPAPDGEEVPAAPTRPGNEALAEDIAPALEGLERADWQIVSIDLESFGLTAKFDDERFMYIMGHTDTVPLDQLIVFDLWGDALTEGSSEELRSRFLEAPDTVLAYLVLMGDQRVDYWDQPLAADVICMSIATADAAWHGGSEEFAQTLAACRERYPTGRIAELLDVMEREHAASMERNHGPRP
ncbi:hypothetical protein [uncultured Oscillibacter sp.]|uniref:hypothetical protein n=1 Tax=uncultured Oscillibacter sp. TaxID=876091 RepID=UPI0025D9309F|nr:hypothetical protein [uncultured Oscillibacter sp.]